MGLKSPGKLLELAYPSMKSQFQQTGQMRSPIRSNGQEAGSAILYGKHRASQGTQDITVIHCNQGSLQL